MLIHSACAFVHTKYSLSVLATIFNLLTKHYLDENENNMTTAPSSSASNEQTQHSLPPAEEGFPSIVSLNLRGTIFETSIDTVTRLPDSMLGSLRTHVSNRL